MESYTNFAEVYDTFMDQTSYEDWADDVLLLMTRFGTARRGEGDTVVDLGCGTGKLTELLAEAGFHMLGIDLSPDMLNIAMGRKLDQGHDTVYICQDIRELELAEPVSTFVSVGDSINYLLSPEDLGRMFRGVCSYLKDEGIFIFDFKTLHLYRDVIGDATIAEDREDCSFIWDNWFHKKDNINEYDLTLFIRDPSAGEDLFRKFEEVHYQRGYTLKEIRKAAEEAGFEWVFQMDSDSRQEVTKDSERIMAVIRKGPAPDPERNDEE